jgi:hypothetical protein
VCKRVSGPAIASKVRPLRRQGARRAVAKLSAAEYHEPSARDARRRIVAFFDAHLKH